MQYPNSLHVLDQELESAPDTKITQLAARLIVSAQGLDIKKAQNLGVNFKCSDVVRDLDNPPHCTTEEVYLSSWSDNVDGYPLEEGERWNEGRRATNTGTKYDVKFVNRGNGSDPQTFDALPDHQKEGYAINPYMNTGMKGFGCLGHAGPNHAVDNGILMIKPDEDGKPMLHALGIIRKYDNDAPAFSGGFAKYSKEEGGSYAYDPNAVVEWQVEEFFEEMISGSVDLLPEYAGQLPLRLAMETQMQALSIRNPRLFKHGKESLLSEERISVLQTEIETELKLEQVRDKDPEFIQRLFNMFAQGHECFAGPVLNDNRNTNNSWIESRLSWVFLDEAKWQTVRGESPVFDYQLSAGDDASGVVAHKIDRDLMRDAYASHGPMFAFMAASYILEIQRQGEALPESIQQQLEDVAQYLERETQGVSGQDFILGV